MTRTRTVLLIAHHYPPCAMSSGVQRTLSFSMHLSRYGWRPVVLTCNPAAYERTSPGQLSDIPEDVPVARSIALDAARHLAIGGRYWSRLALPDRWRSWWLTGVPHGLQLLRRHAVDAIWSTYPIATAHQIGASLSRMTGLPWIADFRDPMVEIVPETGEAFPKDPALRAARLRIEAEAAKRASRLVFCTEGARQIVHERYPALDSMRLAVISNGYEEQAFAAAERLPADEPGPRRVLLHSGTIYPGPDRDPTALMSAIRELRDRGVVSAANFELRLRDPSNEEYFRRLAETQGIAAMVSILPPLPYREALREMLSADGLLILQGFTSNPAVPAKLYEYLRAGRPIVALVHPRGETAATLRRLEITSVAELTDATGISERIREWLALPRGGHTGRRQSELTPQFSRQSLSGELARALDQAVTDANLRRSPT